MSLQTPSDVKVKKEAPVEVDSSPPDSPESISGKSDHSREALVKAKVEKWEVGGLHACGKWNDEESVWLTIRVIMPSQGDDFSGALKSVVLFDDLCKLKLLNRPFFIPGYPTEKFSPDPDYCPSRLPPPSPRLWCPSAHHAITHFCHHTGTTFQPH